MACAAEEPTIDATADSSSSDVTQDASVSTPDVPDVEIGGDTSAADSVHDLSPADAGQGDSSDASGALDVAGLTTCEAYCATVDVACTEQNAVDFGDAGCQSTCEGWDEGSSSDTANDTASCRLFHANAALMNPELHCPYAAPDGGGICVEHGPSVCEQYCIAMLSYCVAENAYDFAELGCEATCEMWPEGTEGGTADLTAHCHLTQALEAEADPAGRCGDAAPGSLVCVEPEPECFVDEDCALGQTCVEEQCEGEAVECVTTEDCEGAQLCESGACVDPPEPDCVMDDDCDANEICTDGECVEDVPPPECTTPENCEVGETCNSGTCEIVTYAEHIQPSLAIACGPCHTTQSNGNTSFASVYDDNLANSYYCPGETVGACIKTRVDDGTMPPGGGAGLSASAKSLLEIWLDGGMAE